MTNRKQIYKVIISKVTDRDLTYTIADVDGYIYGDIGIRRANGKKMWVATHLPSGQKICSAPTRRECYITARDLTGKADKAILQQATYKFQKLLKEKKERIQNEQNK